jgi:hypothetical protein
MVGRTLIIGEDLVGAVGALWGLELHTLCTVTGAELEGLIYTHPMYGPERKSPVVVGGDYITTESGTGLVHTAPGHGQEDYITGLKFGLPLLSPVDDAGDFTAEAGPGLAGKNVLGDGNVACIEGLRACGALILQEAYPHKYPYDWRTKVGWAPAGCRVQGARCWVQGARCKGGYPHWTRTDRSCTAPNPHYPTPHSPHDSNCTPRKNHAPGLTWYHT